MVMDIIGVAGFLKDLYDLVQARTPAFDRVYKQALKKWTKNDGLRDRFADNYLANPEKLVTFIKDPSSVSPAYLDFFRILLDEVKSDSETASMISAEIAIDSYKLQCVIKEDVEEMKSLLKECLRKEELLTQAYKDVDDYIPLTITSDDDKSDFLKRTFSQDPIVHKNLADYIVDGEKRIVLYSHPHHGKSTVLERLAFELQQSQIYTPLLFNLRNYRSTSSLSEQMKLDHRLTNSSCCVLILDGLDEIKEEHRDDVISEISTIALDYPSMAIVLSCRQSHKGLMNISGFKSLYLNKITYGDVISYVNSHCKDPEIFLRDVQVSSISDLVCVPFYLKESLKYYDAYGSIPKDKTDLYDFFINKAFEADSSRKRYRHSVMTPRERLYAHLELLAFVMLMTQKMELTPGEMAEIGIDSNIIEELIGLSLITRGDNGGYLFIHNAFKEYILAKKLSQLENDDIKRLICYQDTEIIIPALKNVVVLLIHVLRVQCSWASSDFKSWFIDKYPEILVEVGHECLNAESRETIFINIYNDHKCKGLYLEYGRLRDLMNFASTRRVVEFLLTEIESSKSLDVNCRNALKLAEYADFSLLTSEKREHAEDVLLSLLNWNGLNIGDYSYVTRPFTNASILSESFLERTYIQVNETKNCYLIQTVCSMAVSLGVSDKYADWVIGKAEFVCDYYENGATHWVSDHLLLEFIRSLSLPVNILLALRFCLPDDRYHVESKEEEKTFHLIPKLLDKLSPYIDANTCNEVLAILDSANIERMSQTVCQSFCNYLETVTDVEMLFKSRIEELLQIDHEKSTDVYELWRKHNLISILLNERRLQYLMTKDTSDDYAVYNIMCRLKSYVSRSDVEMSIINDFIDGKIPMKILENTRQKQFDILFDKSAFESELQRLFAGNEKIDIEKDRERIYLGRFNQTVQSFLFEITKDSNVIDINEALSKLRETELFSVFTVGVLSRFAINSIDVSEEQNSKIRSLVIDLLSKCDEWLYLPHRLIRVIELYKVSLTDDEIMVLFPWSGDEVRMMEEESWSYVHKKFICHIYESLKDKSKFMRQVGYVLAGKVDVCEDFYVAAAECVIEYRISSLYGSMRELMQKITDNYVKVNVAIGLIKLGEKGLAIAEDIYDLFSDEDRLTFYEYLLLREIEPFEGLSAVKTRALESIEHSYHAYTESMKQRALRMLFANGRETALQWCLEMFEECPEWIYADDFPSSKGYCGQHYETLAECFMRSTSGKQSFYSRPHPMYESFAASLKNIAMESPYYLARVKALFRNIATEQKNFKYYNRIADELDVEYYSRTLPPPGLREASLMYSKVCE